MLATICCEIEVIVNSRLYLSERSNEPESITPAHLVNSRRSPLVTPGLPMDTVATSSTSDALIKKNR